MDIGIKHGGLKFKGQTVLWGAAVNSGVWYMINSKYCYPVIHGGRNFQMGPKTRPINQFVDSWLIQWRGTLAITNRARCGKLTGMTA